MCGRVGWRHVVKVFWGSFGKGVAESGTAEDFGGASECWREVLGMITVKGRLKSKVQNPKSGTLNPKSKINNPKSKIPQKEMLLHKWLKIQNP